MSAIHADGQFGKHSSLAVEAKMIAYVLDNSIADMDLPSETLVDAHLVGANGGFGGACGHDAAEFLDGERAEEMLGVCQQFSLYAPT